MRKKFFLLCLPFIYIVGCSKHESTSEKSVASPNVSAFQLQQNEFPIKLHFTWKGFNGTTNCLGGDCGVCFGVCVIINWEVYNDTITPGERAAGIEEAGLKFVNGKLRLRSAGRTMDNGDDSSRIEQDYTLPTAITQEMGVNQGIKILAGTYPVDTSNPRHPFVLLNYTTF
jgi:hypothetical protein